MKSRKIGKGWTVGFAAGIALLVGAVGAPAAEDDAEAKMRELGKNLFDTRCVSCHGRAGTGKGPVAAALKSPPKDLTKIAERNGGKFPERMVEEVIDGRRRMMAHGDRDMPVWGERFFEEGGAISPETMIYALGVYLESIQE